MGVGLILWNEVQGHSIVGVALGLLGGLTYAVIVLSLRQLGDSMRTPRQIEAYAEVPRLCQPCFETPRNHGNTGTADTAVAQGE